MRRPVVPGTGEDAGHQQRTLTGLSTVGYNLEQMQPVVRMPNGPFQRTQADTALFTAIRSEADLVALAATIAGTRCAFTTSERALIGRSRGCDPRLVAIVRDMIQEGRDPLGDTFLRLRSAEQRRRHGAMYTPGSIVDSMLAWAACQTPSPSRVVDPGAGSGRFILGAAARFPKAQLVAIETDPVAILMLRANATTLGHAGRLTIYCNDYRYTDLRSINGTTLFIGNPPYVRHHGISRMHKTWLIASAAALGMKASALAGLHVHFFLRTAQVAKAGDYGTFITSAEWLDVNYGSLVRGMLANGLGGVALHVLAPEIMPFPGTATTGAITCFRVGSRPSTISIRAVKSLGRLQELTRGRLLPWERLEKAPRWSTFLRPTPSEPAGLVPLGELCRVHRGQVTGANRVWIHGAYQGALPPSVLFPSVTKARELLNTGPVLSDTRRLRRVIDLPVDLDELDGPERVQVRRFLEWARRQGAHRGYIATYRRAWWSVGLKPAAPILCTYMARRPPAFVWNKAGARHINIAHGLYPLASMGDAQIQALVRYLSANVGVGLGRTYAGGLTKFEPRELERVLVPRLDDLHDRVAEMDSRAAPSGRPQGHGDLSL
jgi:predicted RNA methylase